MALWQRLFVQRKPPAVPVVQFVEKAQLRLGFFLQLWQNKEG
jgi:hypothetical protein